VNLRKNSIWTLLEYSAYPLLMVIATPIFLSKLGAEQYGLWMLFNTIVQFAMVLNLGIGDATIRLVAESIGEKDAKKMRIVIQQNLRVGWIMFLALIGIAAAIYLLISLISMREIPGINAQVPLLILVPACISVGIKFVEIVCLSIWKGLQRFDISSKFNLAGRSAVVLMNILLVSLGYDLFLVLVATASMQAVVLLIQLYVVRHNIQGVSVYPFGSSKLRISYIKYNFWYWMQSAIGALGFSLDKAFVVALTDLKTFGFYAIASMIGTQIHNLLVSVGAFVFPDSARKKSEVNSLLESFRVHATMVEGLGLGACLFLLTIGPFVLTLWLGDAYADAALFIRLYLIYEAVLLLTIVPYQMINGSDSFRLNTAYEIIFRILQFAAMFVVYKVLGSAYLPLGLLIGAFIILPIQYGWLRKRILKVQFKEFLPELFFVAGIFCLVWFNSLAFDFILSLIIFSAYIFFRFLPFARHFNFRFRNA
jgi:O-antigen/teichoic acid export membrane protein